MKRALALGVEQRADERRHALRGRAASASSLASATSSQKPVDSAHRLEPDRSRSGVGTSPAAAGDGRAPARVAAPTATRRRPAVEAPEAHRVPRTSAPRPSSTCVEPPYGRRRVMQMEFPCSLNSTASTSWRMRKRPRPTGVVELLGRGSAPARASGSKPGPFVGDVHADRVGEELGADVHPLVARPRGCRARWRC